MYQHGLHDFLYIHTYAYACTYIANVNNAIMYLYMHYSQISILKQF